MKQVRIAVGEMVWVDIDELHEFQGDLKELSIENYEKGKKSVLDLGFSFCPHAWESEGKLHLLDGHQRKRILKKMREEGYKIPKVPTIKVEARDYQEAKKKVLAGTSQYGEITNEGLYQFIHESEIDPASLQMSFRFPEIDLPKFNEAYFSEPEHVEFEARGSQEKDEGDFQKFDHTCPKCKFQFNG